MKITLKSLFLATLGFICLSTFSSCSDDDNDGTDNLSLDAVNGYYLGEMTIEVKTIDVPAPTAFADEPEVKPIVVETTIADKTISFDKFPIAPLIETILGPGDYDELIAAVGNLEYNVPFDPTFSASKDGVVMALNPEPIELEIETIPGDESSLSTISVGIEKVDNGFFTYADKKMNFKLNVTSVTMAGSNMIAGKNIICTFNMLNTRK